MDAKANKGKHLTLEDRINILNDLIKGKSLNEIANNLKKDPTTISKEIKKHRYIKESNKSSLTKGTSCKNCANLQTCKVTLLCKNSQCTRLCKSCRSFNVSNMCTDYKEKECKTTKRFPFTCHTCTKKSHCNLPKYYYDPNVAQKDYDNTLVDSRRGLNMLQSEFNKLDEIVSEGVKKGKSIYSIVLNNPEIGKSERTIYRYVAHSYFQVKDIDLRNKVKMKPRKSYIDKSSKEKRILKKETIAPRNYEAYLKYLAENRTSFIPQFDLVQGKKGEGEPYLMTLLFPFSNLMIGFLIPSKEQKEIVKIFDYLEDTLGLESFKKLFPACLTDRGNEFLDAIGIETSKDGETKRTSLFYCDPYSSCQKPEVERNHEFFRFFSPKSNSLKDYNQEEINLIFSHINSYNRKSKDGRTPYELFSYIYGEETISKLNIKKIEFNDIDLTSNLIIKFRKNK